MSNVEEHLLAVELRRHTTIEALRNRILATSGAALGVAFLLLQIEEARASPDLPAAMMLLAASIAVAVGSYCVEIALLVVLPSRSNPASRAVAGPRVSVTRRQVQTAVDDAVQARYETAVGNQLRRRMKTTSWTGAILVGVAGTLGAFGFWRLLQVALILTS